MPREKTTEKAIPLFFPQSYLTTKDNKTGSWRFLKPRYDEKTSPCSVACPAGEDIGRIQMLTSQGLFREAWETILRENPFPGICGRVCYHPCEKSCNRSEFDEAVAIHIVERFLADTATRNKFNVLMEQFPDKKKRIAAIGAGPSGLATAYFLSLLGYSCHVFEATEEPGGILRWAIPLYRLPVEVLRNEIGYIENHGIQIHANTAISEKFMNDMRANYDAIFIGCGHSRSIKLNIPGEDLPGVENGFAFLRKIREGKTVFLKGSSAVIGGGNSAVDVARSLRRLGGDAIILYRRRCQDIPAFEEEVAMAREEGVEIRELVMPEEIVKASSGYVVKMRRMNVTGKEDAKGRAIVKWDGGKEEEIHVDHIFISIGEEGAESWYAPQERKQNILQLNNCVFEHFDNNSAIVFGGDISAAKKSVVHAVASGKEAAIALDIFFEKGLDAIDAGLKNCRVGDGSALSMEVYMKGDRCSRNHHVVSYDEINTDYFELAPRITQPCLLREERLGGFDEIHLKVSASLVMRESERCFNCGICNDCDNCYLFCPDLSVIQGNEEKKRCIDYDYCKGCGVCVVECPRNAMTLEEEMNEESSGGESGGS